MRTHKVSSEQRISLRKTREKARDLGHVLTSWDHYHNTYSHAFCAICNMGIELNRFTGHARGDGAKYPCNNAHQEGLQLAIACLEQTAGHLRYARSREIRTVLHAISSVRRELRNAKKRRVR